VDSDEIIDTLGVIARARGMANLTAKIRLGRESLDKTFAPGAKPRFDILRSARIIKEKM